MVKEGKLVPRPEFQRRLVWTRKDKDFFLDTILRGYPFPEIYLADGDVDLESGEGSQLLVDGLQRVNTLIEYFDASPNLKLLTVSPYRDLEEEQKRLFLQYDVAVRDLGAASREEIVEVFQRLNATNYSLLDIEINNAIYKGELKQFAEKVAAHQFFTENGVYNVRDYKRMGDLRYALTLIITFIGGYFNRDDPFGELLDRFNDEFPLEQNVWMRLENVIELLNECGFEKGCRIWKKADLFTVMVELDSLLESSNNVPQPSEILGRLMSFYTSIDSAGVDGASVSSVYYKAAVQATNDKVNRLRRAAVISSVILGHDNEAIWRSLQEQGFGVGFIERLCAGVCPCLPCEEAGDFSGLRPAWQAGRFLRVPLVW